MRFVLVLCTAFLLSCNTPEQKPYVVRVLKYLPHDVKDVKEIGNGWISFSLETNGKTRKFIGKPGRTAYEIYVNITEISP